jgi:glyoxylase I family protein
MTELSFEHAALNVSDPRAMANWYVAHLGMQVVRRVDEPPHTHFLVDAGGAAMIEIYGNPKAPVDTYASLHPLQLHLAFTCADPGGGADRLVSAGATLVEHAHLPDGSHLAMLRDPWGLPIQLCRRAVPMLNGSTVAASARTRA